MYLDVKFYLNAKDFFDLLYILEEKYIIRYNL